MNHYDGNKHFDRMARPATAAALLARFKDILDATAGFMDYQKPATDSDIRRCMAYVSSLAYTDDGKPINDAERHTITAYLFGDKTSIKSLTRAEIWALTDYVSHGATAACWRAEVHAILRARLVELGQMSLPWVV
jgi:hypothetical protein